jgi:cytochrome c peroxidase
MKQNRIFFICIAKIKVSRRFKDLTKNYIKNFAFKSYKTINHLSKIIFLMKNLSTLSISFTSLIFISAVIIFIVSCQQSQDIEPEYILNTPEAFGKSYIIPKNNSLTYKGIALGRMLFYEKKLSGDNTISCATCHQQSKAFTDGLAFAKGVSNRQREVGSMSLSNLLWTRKFNWTGNANSLEEQVLMPIQHANEMNQNIDTLLKELQESTLYRSKFKEAFGNEIITKENIAKALSQFLRTLISSNSKYDRYLRGEYQPTDSELRGINLWQHPYPQRNIRGANCGDCHKLHITAGAPNDFEGFHNNGLDTDATLKDGLMNVTKNPSDKGKFKAPTLRNISLTAPYMHDGRFQTLEEVIEHYDSHIQLSTTLDPLILEATNLLFVPQGKVQLALTPQEKKDLIAFLNMLTDESFIQNKEFSNPF